VSEDPGIDGYAVCANGVVLYNVSADRVVWQRSVSPQRLVDLASTLDEPLPGCPVLPSMVDIPDAEPCAAEIATCTRGTSATTWMFPRAEVVDYPALRMPARHPDVTSSAMAAAPRPTMSRCFAGRATAWR
jgi:hypothetical protein